MMEFSTILNSEMLTFQAPDFSPIGLIQKLGMATLLGILLSLVARWTYTGKRKNQKLQRAVVAMQHTHILVCLSGAFIMIIIGNSLANAFALTGALSMVRFRTNLIDPKEAAIIILFIAIGMACGLDLFITAIIMALLTCLILGGMFWQHYRHDQRRMKQNQALEEQEEEECLQVNE
ncbi:MAG: DUF4956 domain-containing protein [SAR324 cluster bacterium]|nr:DUF4956 domain-containing protein [SAR324 cluster bacterium]